MARVTTLLLTASLVFLSACGGGGSGTSAEGASTESTSATPTVETITVTGLLREVTLQPTCNLSLMGFDVANTQITVRDGSNSIIGTTQTGAVSFSKKFKQGIVQVCGVGADYSIKLPKTDFYQFSVEGIDKPEEPISYAKLAAKKFNHDIIINGGADFGNP
jgi:hypothetical protein